MADAYIHSTGSGTSPYDTWEKAANNEAQTQAVVDAAVAGETIHAAGTITLTARLDIDQNSGSVAVGFIKFVGYNASHVNDGTRFILDGNDATASVIYNSAKSYWLFENIEVKNSSSASGFDSSGCDYNVFVNCCSNNNAVAGFNTYRYIHSTFIRCIAYANTSYGFGQERYQYTKYFFCRARDNGGAGFDFIYTGKTLAIGCIADNNGTAGFGEVGSGTTLFNCVSDNNTTNGIRMRATAFISSVIGCRSTNHSGTGDVGLDLVSQLVLYGWNYYQNNDGANVQNATVAYEIPYNGSGTDTEDQGDTESGYVNEDDPEDYNLRDTATSRRTAISIPES